MSKPLPPEARTAAALVSSGCAITATELDAMPQSRVEVLVLLREVVKTIEYGLEVTLT